MSTKDSIRIAISAVRVVEIIANITLIDNEKKIIPFFLSISNKYNDAEKTAELSIHCCWD